jgi:hypothetical protein
MRFCGSTIGRTPATIGKRRTMIPTKAALMTVAANLLGFFPSSSMALSSSAKSPRHWTSGQNEFITSVHGERGDIITVCAKDEGKQTAAIVICHGLGDSAHGFLDVAEVGQYN